MGFIIIAIISSFISAGIVFFYMHKKMETVMDKLLQRLDRAIHGDIQENIYDESMDAAITQRLNQLLQMTGMHKEQAETERDTIKTLISDISHQVRTPLSNIMLYTQLLKEREFQEDIRGLEDVTGFEDIIGLIDKIQKHSEKLDFFMKELVKSSYAEQEIISVTPVIVPVEELIDRACQNIELAALKKKIIIKKEIEREELCYADRKWTIEALGNLLENAVKYSPQQSIVDIKTVRYESFLCIKVKDFGIGIEEEEHGKVFERFYRSKQVKDQPGFGIGLYLAREICHKQGGYIKLKSELGKGTTAEMYLSVPLGT